MRSPAVAIVTLVAFVLLAMPPRCAWADETGDLAAAKQHFEAGRSAYLGGDYAKAIAEFQAAQQIRPSPILDYNIGLSYEALSDGPNAYAAYQRYLAGKPDAQNRAEVEQRMAAIAQQQQQQQQPPPPPPQSQPQPPKGTDPYGQGYYQQQPPPPQPAPPPKKKSYWWIVFPIVGGAAVTGLIIWAILANSNSHCGPPDCNGNYASRPLSLEPGMPSAAAPAILPGEVLRF